MSGANLFKVLADKQRRDILVMLKNGRRNAGEIAEGLGSPKSQNICLLGALVKALKLADFDWEGLIAEMVPPKTVQMNLAAFRKGLEA